MVTLASETTKTTKEKKRKKWRKITKRGGGPEFGEEETRNPPDPLALSLSLKTHSLFLSPCGHGRRLASPLTATCRRREKGTTGPLSHANHCPEATNRRPPFSQLKTDPNMRPPPGNRPPTCWNRATHASLGLLYKLGTEFEPKTTKNATPMGIMPGFCKNAAGIRE